MNCENCMRKSKVAYLEKENEQLQTRLNEAIVQLNFKITEALLLKDRVEHLEREVSITEVQIMESKTYDD